MTTLSVDLLKDRKLAQLQLSIDQELADQCRALGCRDPQCGGKLHKGDYPRSPRSCAPEVQTFFEWRFSFNCACCDKRVTPPSVRFLGGAWRTAAVLVLMGGRGMRSVSWLSKHLEVPVRTVKRWRRWWRERFVESKFWEMHRADFAPPVDRGQLPDSALERFSSGDATGKLIQFLRFLSPLSIRSGS